MLVNRNMSATSHTDTLLSSVKSVGGYTWSQMFVTDFDDVVVYPMEHCRDSPVSLIKYFRDKSVKNNMHMEKFLEYTSKHWQDVCG